MIEEIDVINRRERHYIPFESRKPRERNICPMCNSLSVRKRHRTNDYTCPRCGWIGEATKKMIW